MRDSVLEIDGSRVSLMAGRSYTLSEWRQAPFPRNRQIRSTLESSRVIGLTLGHYRIVEELGGGGMGVVYRAEDVRLGRSVAIKVLPEQLRDDPLALERFNREARAAAALNHPAICIIHDVGHDQGHAFIAMELLEGRTLKQLVEHQPLPSAELLQYA